MKDWVISANKTFVKENIVQCVVQTWHPEVNSQLHKQ